MLSNRYFAICFSLFSFFVLNASAQTLATENSSVNLSAEIQSYDQWAVKCPEDSTNKSECILFQRLTLTNGQQFLMFQVTKDKAHNGKEKERYRVIFTLPLGIYLPAGITVQINDGEILPLQYERCDHDGCYAGMIADDKFIDACIRGRTAEISFETLGGQTIVTPMSLYGFTAGLEALQ